MLSAGEKKVNGQGAGPLDPKPLKVGEDFLNARNPDFKTIDQLPVCEFEGSPKIQSFPDTYLEAPQQLWILPKEHVADWQQGHLKSFLLEYRKPAYDRVGKPYEERLPQNIQTKLVNGTEVEKRVALEEGVEWLYGQITKEEFEDFKETFAIFFPEKKANDDYSIFLPPGEKESLLENHPFKKLVGPRSEKLIDPKTKKENWDKIFRDIQSSRNNFDFTYGDSVKRFHLCRNDVTAKNENENDPKFRTKIYAAVRNVYLDNKDIQKKNPTLFSKAEGFPQLTYRERVMLPVISKMTDDAYYYEDGYQDESAKLFIRTAGVSELPQIETYIKNIGSATEWSTPEKRVAIVKAMESAIQILRRQKELQDKGEERAKEQMTLMKEQMTWMQLMFGASIAMGLPTILFIVGQWWTGRKAKKSILPDLPDLTKLAREKKLAPVSSRLNAVIKELATQLSKGALANPTLLSENGVGKSAAVEGLAMAIVNGELPDGTPLPSNLKGKRILLVNPMEVFAATEGGQYRGMMEQKFLRFIKDVENANKGGIRKRLKGDAGVIPFIDEVHSLIGIGGSKESADVSQMLKARTARGSKFQFIAATTISEYNATVAKDSALAARMPRVSIATPNAKTALQDLLETQQWNEDRLKLKFANGALNRIVELSEHDTVTNFPRKAIDLMNSVAADLKVQGVADGTIITPQQVTDYVAKRNEGNLKAGIDAAIATASDPTKLLSAKELQQLQLASVEKVVGSLDNNRALIFMIQMAWNNAGDQVKAIYRNGGSLGEIPESFIRRVMDQAGESQSNVKPSSKKGPPPPPLPPAAGATGAGDVDGAWSFGDDDGGDSVKRISLADKLSELGNRATEKAGELWHSIDPLKGTAGMLGAFVAADVAEHYGVITQEQKEKGGLTLMAGAALLNPGMLIHAVTQFLPSEATAWASTGLAKATGLETFKEGGLGNKVTRTVGNFVGGEALVYGTGVRSAVKSGAALKEAAGLQSWVRGNEMITQWGADKIGAVYNAAGRPFEKQVAVATNMRNAMVNGIRNGGSQAVTAARTVGTQTVQAFRTHVPQLLHSARTFIPNARAALAAGGTAMIGGEAAMAAAPGFASIAAIGATAAVGSGLLGGFTAGTLTDNAFNDFAEENKLGTALDLGTYDLPASAPEKYKSGNWKFVPDGE